MSMSNAIIGERVHMDGLYLKLLKEEKKSNQAFIFFKCFFLYIHESVL